MPVCPVPAGDGLISHQDFVTAMTRHDSGWVAPDRRAQLDAMYAAVDLDGDGKVDFADFAVMRVRKKNNTATPRSGSIPTFRAQPGAGPQPSSAAIAAALAAQARVAAAPPGTYGAPPLPGLPQPHCSAPHPQLPQPVLPLGGGTAMGGLAAHLAGMHSARGGGGMGHLAEPSAELSPRASFLPALVQAYYRLNPNGDGWLPSAELQELLCAVAHTCAMPLAPAHAAELCGQVRQPFPPPRWKSTRPPVQAGQPSVSVGPHLWQADERGDGWINLHQLLAMRSVTLYFDRLQARQGGPPPMPLQMGAHASHAGVHSPREFGGPVSPRAQIEKILADADSQAQQARAALDELARREQEVEEQRRQAGEDGGKAQAELEAAIMREARSEAAATARLAREGEDRARWEAELQERITRKLQATVQEQLQVRAAAQPEP